MQILWKNNKNKNKKPLSLMRNNIKLTMDLVIKLCVLTIVSKVYGMDLPGQYITFHVTMYY